jgi:hypothetical protein
MTIATSDSTLGHPIDPSVGDAFLREAVQVAECQLYARGA